MGVVPRIESPPPGATLTTAEVAFGWSAHGAAVDDWWIAVESHASTPGGARRELHGGRVVVAGLPLDGRSVHAVLWYRIGDAWAATSADYTMAVDPAGRAGTDDAAGFCASALPAPSVPEGASDDLLVLIHDQRAVVLAATAELASLSPRALACAAEALGATSLDGAITERVTGDHARRLRALVEGHGIAAADLRFFDPRSARPVAPIARFTTRRGGLDYEVVVAAAATTPLVRITDPASGLAVLDVGGMSDADLLAYRAVFAPVTAVINYAPTEGSPLAHDGLIALLAATYLRSGRLALAGAFDHSLLRVLRDLGVDAYVGDGPLRITADRIEPVSGSGAGRELLVAPGDPTARRGARACAQGDQALAQTWAAALRGCLGCVDVERGRAGQPVVRGAVAYEAALAGVRRIRDLPSATQPPPPAIQPWWSPRGGGSPVRAAIAWWQRLGIQPALVALEDEIAGGLPTTDPVRIAELAGDDALALVQITGLPADAPAQLAAALARRVGCYLDWHAVVATSPALRQTATGWAYRAGDLVPTEVDYEVREQWIEDPRLSAVLERAHAGARQATIAAIHALRVADGPPVGDHAATFAGRSRAIGLARPAHEAPAGGPLPIGALCYVFPTDGPPGSLLVGGATFATYAALVDGGSETVTVRDTDVELLPLP